MSNKILNIGIFAHVDSGKTTLFERILFELGAISAIGKIEEGTTESDKLKEEIKRGISIFSTCFSINYKHKKKNVKFNFIDTPGHLDFFLQVKQSLEAIDFAILLIDINAGVRSQTEKIYLELLQKKIPTFLFINKIDKNSNVEEFLIDISENFSKKIIPFFDSNFKSILFEKEINENIELNYLDWSNELSEKYLKKPSKKILQESIYTGFFKSEHIPVLCGSALTGFNIKELIQFFLNLEYKLSELEESGKIIKRIFDEEFGNLYLIKTFKELAVQKNYFYLDKKIQFEKFYEFEVSDRTELDLVLPNSIYYAKLKNISENLKLDSEKFYLKPKKIEEEKFHTRDYYLLIEPKKEEDRTKLLDSLEKLTWEDSGLEFKIKLDTAQIELYGLGELHLEVAISRLKEFSGEIFQISNFEVAKYELWKNMTLKVSFEHSAFNQKLKSGFLNCYLEKSSDFSNRLLWEFELEEDLKSSVESAVYEILSNGLNGYSVLGLQIRFVSYENDSITEATHSVLKVATISGIKSSLKNNTTFIGPLVQFEIILPESFYGSVLAILQKRLAKILKVDVTKNNKTLLIGEASAEKMLGFQSALRNMTQGKGIYSSRVVFDKDTYYAFY